MVRRLAATALAAALLAPAVASARMSPLLERVRKTQPRDLAVPVEKLVLPNGFVVLLAPDDSTSSVFVCTTFRAGTLYEPRGRSGMAHLVEHVMATGPTPDTNYAGMFEQRRARYFNAHTSYDSLAFEVLVPAEELPFALWASADRLLAIPPLVDAAQVDKHRRIVIEERALRQVDRPYGLVDEVVDERLFADPHPLHGGIIGTLDGLGQVTPDDVRAFVADRLVPANGIVAIAGRFDRAAVLQELAKTLGRLPPGARAAPPTLARLGAGLNLERKEAISRQPRVTMAWRFPGVTEDHAAALALGAQLLSFYVDGAWGMRIDASFQNYTAEGAFRIDVTLPYDEPARVVEDDAESFVRMLTLRQMPDDLAAAAHLALDRSAMYGLDSLVGRALLLTRLELLFGSPERVAEDVGHHWELEVDIIRDIARIFLKGPRVVIHARPVRPRPAREERDE